MPLKTKIYIPFFFCTYKKPGIVQGLIVWPRLDDPFVC